LWHPLLLYFVYPLSIVQKIIQCSIIQLFLKPIQNTSTKGLTVIEIGLIAFWLWGSPLWDFLMVGTKRETQLNICCWQMSLFPAAPLLLQTCKLANLQTYKLAKCMQNLCTGIKQIKQTRKKTKKTNKNKKTKKQKTNLALHIYCREIKSSSRTRNIRNIKGLTAIETWNGIDCLSVSFWGLSSEFTASCNISSGKSKVQHNGIYVVSKCPDFQLLFVLFSCCHSSSSANTELYINININIKHNFLGRNTEKKQLEEPQNLCYCGHQIFKVFLLEKSNQVMGEVVRCTKITQLSEFAQHINLIGSTEGGVHEYSFH